MPFYLQQLCHTTGYQNNCGLNCLVHFLISKLQSGELQSRYANHPRYNAILETFREYYGLQQKPTWDQMNRLLAQNYADPVSQEIILGPVLRIFLGKLMAEPDYIRRFWDNDGVGALSDYVKRGIVEDTAQPVVIPNQQWFEKLKADYERDVTEATDLQKHPIVPDSDEYRLHVNQLQRKWSQSRKEHIRQYFSQGTISEREKGFFEGNKTWIEGLKAEYDRRIRQADPNERDRVTDAFFAAAEPPIVHQAVVEEIIKYRTENVYVNIERKAQNDWIQQKGKLFAQLMGDPNAAQQVSTVQLDLVAKELGIYIEVYVDDSEVNKTTAPYILDNPWFKDDEEEIPENAWRMKVFNPEAGHWELEEPSGSPELAEMHNQAYFGDHPGISAEEVRDAIQSQQALDVSPERPVSQAIPVPAPIQRPSPPYEKPPAAPTLAERLAKQKLDLKKVAVEPPIVPTPPLRQRPLPQPPQARPLPVPLPVAPAVVPPVKPAVQPRQAAVKSPVKPVVQPRQAPQRQAQPTPLIVEQLREKQLKARLKQQERDKKPPTPGGRRK